MISITVAGNVGKDDAKPVGDKGARFSIAGSYYDRDAKEKRTKWFDVIVWGRDADYALNKAKRGTPITVTGSLSFREYQGKEYAQIQASAIKIQGGSDGATRSSGNRGGGYAGGGYGGNTSGRGGSYGGGGEADAFGDDDLPFAPEW